MQGINDENHEDYQNEESVLLPSEGRKPLNKTAIFSMVGVGGTFLAVSGTLLISPRDLIALLLF
jgi:hypothetical protein